MNRFNACEFLGDMTTDVHIEGYNIFTSRISQTAQIVLNSDDFQADSFSSFHFHFPPGLFTMEQIVPIFIVDYKKDDYIVLYSCYEYQHKIVLRKYEYAWILHRSPSINATEVKEIEKKLLREIWPSGDIDPFLISTWSSSCHRGDWGWTLNSVTKNSGNHDMF